MWYSYCQICISLVALMHFQELCRGVIVVGVHPEAVAHSSRHATTEGVGVTTNKIRSIPVWVVNCVEKICENRIVFSL